jgi:GDP-4-dehydro-6-deoxy-D-mannose reductase
MASNEAPPRRLLVTGAGGFVGLHLLAALRAAFPHALLIAAARPSDDRPAGGLTADRIVRFDLLDHVGFDAMITTAMPDGLVHLAAQSSVAASFGDPVASWQANCLGTVALAEAVLRRAPQCRFVLASSAEVYGMSFRDAAALDEAALLAPANPYAAAKAAADLAIGEMTLRGLQAIRLRPFNHTGPGQSDRFVVADFARQIAAIEAGSQPPVLRVGALDRWRDFLDVRDVCAAYIAALRAPAAGGVFNIASGTARRIGDVLDALLARSAAKPVVEAEPDRMRPTDVRHVCGLAARARQQLGWEPRIGWDATLDAVIADWRARTPRP